MSAAVSAVSVLARPLWPTQEFGITEVLRLRAEGRRRLCLTSPTGGGKSVMICELIARELEGDGTAVLYTNRKMLREQLSGVLEAHGIRHGTRAAGAEDGMERRVQVSSLQTEHSRVYRQKRWELHRATLAVIDECHLQKGAVAQRISADHLDAGGTVVGVTATPLDLDGRYEVLVQAGKTSELRRCGALVLADHYGPDEPDARLVGKTKTGEYELDGKVRAIWSQQVFGRVLSEWRRLNPQQRPTILFAPGVGESLWFAEQFEAAGVAAAHIDGTECWIGGKYYASDRAARDAVLAGIRDGSIKIVCNRFVLREGIDVPELEHGILATVFGSLQSYLQSGGRLLRACAATGKAGATVQDHGGNWWRHGSLNADRVWALGDTARVTNGLREDMLREKKAAEPIVCPRCFAVRLPGPSCHRCGFETHRKSRLVVQADGTLTERAGDIVRPRRVEYRDDTVELWKRMYYRTRKNGRTFKQAEGLFFVENHYFPPHDLPLMPTNPEDWYRAVKEVPTERLT
jgi:DNA repair protein RadD